MKKVFMFSLFMLCISLIVPLIFTDNRAASPGGEYIMPNAKNAASDSFRICNMPSDTVTEISADDYIFGVVAAEMPANYEIEALKAQAVAAYTFACRKKSANKDKSYDLTDDPSLDQSFITKEEAAKKWGGKAEEYTEKIENAVKSVKGYMLTYSGKPALAVYHALSSGKTEDCENVWGENIPYLKPVPSEWDKTAPNFKTTVKFSESDVKKTFSDECKFGTDPEKWFSNPKYTESGTVSEITVGGQTLKGARVRSLLSLKSSAFEIEYTDECFTFNVTGYGHGVGMSQYGANCMAKQGSDFKEILTHYYKGCKVQKSK